MSSLSLIRRAVIAGISLLVVGGVASVTLAPAEASPAVEIPATVTGQQQAELDAYLNYGLTEHLQFAWYGMPWPATRRGPYVERVEWRTTGVGPSLQIHPTKAGREATGWDLPGIVWREVLAKAAGIPIDHAGGWPPNAPGMRSQFDCHWVFARLVEPDKPSWNLEPARPVVTALDMIATRCNPGFSEE